jgi:hypothetical protein
MVCLDSDVLMWWRYFGNFHQSWFKTQFWQCSRSDPTKPNQSGSGPIKPNWAQLGAWFWRCSQFWRWPLEIRELTFPQKCWKCQILILCGVSLCRGAGECPIWLLLTLVETLFAFSFSSSCLLSSFSSSLSFWYSLAHLTITWQMTFGGNVPSGRSEPWFIATWFLAYEACSWWNLLGHLGCQQLVWLFDLSRITVHLEWLWGESGWLHLMLHPWRIGLLCMPWWDCMWWIRVIVILTWDIHVTWDLHHLVYCHQW